MKSEMDNIWIGEKDLTKDERLMEQNDKESSLPGAGDVDFANLGSTRRDFLRMLGFGVGAATLASCEIPIKRAIPYVVKPDEIVPGVATYYASSIVNGGDFASVLVKTREGRPIKIEGNSLSSVTHGATGARVQASVLDLYDVDRLKVPMMASGDSFEETSWEKLDEAAKAAFGGANTAILSSTVMSPSLIELINEAKAKNPSLRHVQYDAISSSAMLDANEKCFGERVVPDYHFDKADVIVSFGADFLGTWISPQEYARDFGKGRKIKDIDHAKMSRLYQVESSMSLTGTNADNRIRIRPSQMGAAIAFVYNRTAGSGATESGLTEKQKSALSSMISSLSKAKNGLVVSSSNNMGEQVLVNAINNSIGSYGKTITFSHASMQRKGSDKDLRQLKADMASGRVSTLVVMGANPCYDTPDAAGFKEAIAKVPNRIALSYKMDETTAACNWVAPVHHNLESWGDVEAKKGQYSLMQPTISPLFNTRQAEESLLIWSGNAVSNFHDYLKKTWAAGMMAGSSFGTFSGFWQNVLHDGVYENSGGSELSYSDQSSSYKSKVSKSFSGGMEMDFMEKVGLGDGRYANNPWLQELADPITRCTWGNYLATTVSFDGNMTISGMDGIEDDGELVEVSVNGDAFTIPCIKQFGQTENVMSLALGYGRTKGGVCARNIGHNVYPYLTIDEDGNTQYYSTNAKFLGTTKRKEKYYSSVQYHHTMGLKAEGKEGDVINADEEAIFGGKVRGMQGGLTKRSIIRGAHVEDIASFATELIHEREHHQHLNDATLYPGHDDLYSNGHHWGMHIDLNACLGCGSCAVACMAENNVPVVGKKEVSRHHEMTWLRIDRYYYGDFDNPNVVYQPMMCQHCDNAPCENVCPVNATNHSSEGINQMAYNRCVGTRYCANNCPYKVRRFNWLDYTTADTFPDNEPNLMPGVDSKFGESNLTRMVLNPDVTVRSRGVIEKCSFCVQRIQEGKLTAKVEGRRLRDADVKTACQTACPTGAITFGDQNNKEGDLSIKNNSPLNYIVLEEVNTQSSVNYSARINNRDKSIEA